jgi:hypothetical protein
VLAVRDQFPSMMIRAVYHVLAAAYAAMGRHDSNDAEHDEQGDAGRAT